MPSTAHPNVLSPDDITTALPIEPSNNTNAVPLITQPDDFCALDLLTEAIAIDQNNFLSPSAENANVNLHYTDHTFTNQIPAVTQPPNSPVTTPVVTSPRRALFRPSYTDLSHDQRHRKRDGSNLIISNQRTTFQHSKRVEPATSLLTFLRDGKITQLYNERNGKPLNVDKIIRSSLNNWHDKRKISYIPYMDLYFANIFENAPPSLSIDDGRLLLEDYMILQPGSQVTILFSKNHSILTSTASKARGLQNLFKAAIRFNPFQPLQFQRTVYFAIKATVRSNVFCDDFTNGIKTQHETKQLLVKSSGAGITFSIQFGSGENDIDNVCLFYSNFLDHPLDIMFWTASSNRSPAARNTQFKKTLHNHKDIIRMGAAVEVYKDEVYGDKLQTYALVELYERKLLVLANAKELENYKKEPISDARIQQHLQLPSNDLAFQRFHALVDDSCQTAIINLYGMFSPMSSPILTQLQLTTFTESFKTTLPTQYKAIMCFINKEEKQMKRERIKRNRFLWDRYAFYIFILLMRIRNPRNFVWWSMCNAASQYGHGGSNLSVFFGISVSQTTLLRKLDDINKYDSITMKTISSMKFMPFVLATFDNSQIIRKKKFQSGGESSSVTLVTSRMFIKPMIPHGLSLFNFPHNNDRPEITYFGQRIPSAFGMPKYEEIENISFQVFQDEKYRITNSTTDLTGERVDSYAKLVLLSHKMKMFRRIIPFWLNGHRFQFQNDNHHDSMVRLRVVQRLAPINTKAYQGKPSGWLLQIGDGFQQSSVNLWRNGGNITPASALLPPICPHDEITNIGAGQNIVSLLLLRGILEATDFDGTNGDMRKIRLAPDYKNKWMMLVGDGLTQMRVRTFVDIINKSCYDFGQQQEKMAMIKEALGQVIHITGDLHGGLFHFLSANYSLFYPCLIQIVQELLAWKRICGSDITKCYQQAAGLAIMIADELERQMLAAYFETVCNDNESFERFQRADGPENFAIMIAKGYMEWMDEKRKSTTDEVFLMVLNFIDITNLYREFKLALNTGDAIMIEWLYKEFLPIYLYTGKKNYFEIVCGMMEEMYGKLDYKLLHLTRINRTIPLYTGVDTDGRPMANWAIDALIELVQKFYHKMNFRNDNLEGWMQHSPNVQLNNKSIRLAKTEYHRFYSEAEKDLRNGTGNENDLDQARNRKKTSEPKRLQEHLAIAERTEQEETCFGRVYGIGWGRRQCISIGSKGKAKSETEDIAIVI